MTSISQAPPLAVVVDRFFMEGTMGNTWPAGYRHAISQCEHEKWNANNYPGTLQICYECDEPTGNCEEDESLNKDGKPVCDKCYNKNISNK